MMEKRIPVTTETWATLSKLKEPGESFDTLLNRLMDIEGGIRLANDLKGLEMVYKKSDHDKKEDKI